MDSMEKVIKAHNTKLTNTNNQQKHPTCNCRNKENCPLPGQCTANNIIYEATVTTQQSFKTYIGLTSNTFKTRYSSHKASFNNQRNMNDTELSKYVWDLKQKGTQYKITWRILRYAQPYSPRSRRCQLCLWENSTSSLQIGTQPQTKDQNLYPHVSKERNSCFLNTVECLHCITKVISKC